MFFAALFTIARTWKQPRYPLADEWKSILCSEFSIEDLRKIYKIGYNDDVKANQLVEKIKDINS